MITSAIASRFRRLSSAWPQPMLRRPTPDTTIPQQLRFVWGLLGGGEMPRQQGRYLSRWRELHEGWNLTIHNRQEIADVAAHYSDYPFASYPKDIQRCDVCRLMLLHRYGGVYSDLDVEPSHSLDELFARYPQASVILGVEVCLSRKKARWIGQEMAIRQGVPEVRRRIANFFMASVPGHPFWLAALELARSRASLPVRNQYDILYTTGPDIVSETLQRNASRFPDVAVVPQHILRQFMTHHCAGGWRDF